MAPAEIWQLCDRLRHPCLPSQLLPQPSPDRKRAHLLLPEVVRLHAALRLLHQPGADLPNPEAALPNRDRLRHKPDAGPPLLLEGPLLLPDGPPLPLKGLPLHLNGPQLLPEVGRHNADLPPLPKVALPNAGRHHPPEVDRRRRKLRKAGAAHRLRKASLGGEAAQPERKRLRESRRVGEEAAVAEARIKIRSTRPQTQIALRVR